MKAKTQAKRGGIWARAIAQPPKGESVPVACPECQGPIWEVHDGKLVRFECLVGHRYSMDNLLAAQSEELESALWIALRTLEERINLQSRLACDAQAAGLHCGRQIFQTRLAENYKHAKVLRGILEKLKSRV